MTTEHRKPFILYEGKNTPADVEKFKEKHGIKETRDMYESQLQELFGITYPSLRSKPDYQKRLNEFIKTKTQPGEILHGNWIYFPWSHELFHIVAEAELFALRTNRNKNLITHAEQEKLYQFTVGVAGLSIGGGIALSVAYSGISKAMKLADYDVLETTNLNRIRAGLRDIGAPKIGITARQIYEVNPYADLFLFDTGITQDTLREFVSGDPAPNLIFEAIDDFEMKIRLRLAAREAGIPIVMLTNLGDSILIDVERYDLDRKLSLFNGLIGNIHEEILSKPITEADKQKYAVSIVGIENVPKRALESLPEIGKTLVGRPQLMSTVTVAVGIAAYLARRIALGESVPSGRKLVRLQNIFIL